MNKFSIFHTSHCGSTLLASLISKSIKTYAEPSWAYLIHNEKSFQEARSYVLFNHPDNSLVKYSSVYCYISPHLPDKKVFLYRKLKRHIQKHFLGGFEYSGSLRFHRSIMKDHMHQSVNMDIPSDDPFHACACLWVDRFLWMKEASDVFWIDSDELFINPKGTAENVCNHFGIKYIPVDIDYHVKRAHLLGIDTPLNIDNVNEKNKMKYNTTSELINDFEFVEISDTVEKIKNSFPMIEKRFIQ